MKHHVTLSALIIATSCLAMEKEKQNLQEITAIQNPRQAFFLTDNRAVVNGESGCSIIDLSTNKEVKQISNITWQHLVLNHNKTKIALYNTDKIKIFDTQTGNEEYTTDYLQRITSVIFNEHDNIILACQNPDHNVFDYHAIVHINNKNKSATIREDNKTHSFFQNPAKNYVYSATCSGSETKIYSYLNDLSDAYNCIKTINNNSCFYECSPNGSLLAIANGNTLYLFDTNSSNNSLEYFEEWGENYFKEMQFHPNSLYIAVLMEHQNSKNVRLRYFNNKAKHITETSVKIDQSKKTPVRRSRRDPETWINPASVSFAPNGKTALVTLHNQCFSIPVPFKVVYQDDAKERTVFLYWILKNYQIDDSSILPNDIKTIITQMFLEMLKR